jgi:hypothetical protein
VSGSSERPKRRLELSASGLRAYGSFLNIVQLESAWKTHLLPEDVGRHAKFRIDISFREQFLKLRELRIQLTLRPWPIAGPRR